MKQNRIFIPFLLNIAVLFWLMPLSECRSECLWARGVPREIQSGARCEADASDGVILKSGINYEEETVEDLNPLVLESPHRVGYLLKAIFIPQEFEVQQQAVYTEKPPRSPPFSIFHPILTIAI